MKTTVLFFSMLVTSLAHASYNSNKEGMAVRCTSSQLSVSLNKARSEITVIKYMDMDKVRSEKYLIPSYGKDSDGDTFVTYLGIPSSKNSGISVELSFDDQGDTLTYRDENPIQLKCK